MKKNFTWTGKTKKGKRKIAFRRYKEIVNLIYAVVRRADSSYSMGTCKYDLTYRVLKYAAKPGDSDSEDVEDRHLITTETVNCTAAGRSSLPLPSSYANGPNQDTVQSKQLVTAESSTLNDTKLFELFLKMYAQNK